MGKVLIIKNGNHDRRINDFAKQSYEQKKMYFYNLLDGMQDENTVKKMKSDIGKDDIILLITYKNTNLEEIKDVYIGDQVLINEKNNVGYIMKVYLDNSLHGRVINSILDKIDLNIDSDFEHGQYITTSDMESLYQELKERIFASQYKKEKRLTSENLIREESPYCLHRLAQRDSQSERVFLNNCVGENRTEFQRDRERVVNCMAFRRLVDKAQIFGAEKGDYYRTRMTHSLEVNQIAKAIAYALHLNLDLTEAIALGHDLGHTPFGHQGERTLDEILCGKINVGIVATENMFEKRCYGGFKHNYQSAKILTEIEEKYKEYPGLNVSVQVIEGVLKHTKLKPEIALEDFLTKEYIDKLHLDDGKYQVCSSLEGQTVAIADEIAQRGHDVDDALTSGVMTVDELLDRLQIAKCQKLRLQITNEIHKVDDMERLISDKKNLVISRIVSSIVNYFIRETIAHSLSLIETNSEIEEITMDNDIKMVCFSPEVKMVNDYLEKVVQKKVICNYEVARADHNASVIIQKLFEKYYKNPRLLHTGTIHKIFIETLNHPNVEVSRNAILLSDASVRIVNDEIREITQTDLDEEIILKHLNKNENTCREKDVIIFEKRKILIRAITDYIAGMTDGYAMEEYNKLK